MCNLLLVMGDHMDKMEVKRIHFVSIELFLTKDYLFI
jgi:hypothetical protein